MSLRIHAIMKDSHDENTRVSYSIVNHMPLNTSTSVAWSNMITCRRCFWRYGDIGESRKQNIGIAYRLIESPLLIGMIPNILQVTLGGRSQKEVSHVLPSFWL